MKKLVIFGIEFLFVALGILRVGLVNRGIRLNGNTDFQWNAVC